MANRDFFAVNTNEPKNAHIGAALLFTATYGTAFPTSAASVVALSGATQWNPVTGWSVLGATKTGIKVERSFSKVDRSSDQSFGPYDERPNNWTQMVTTELLETTLTNLQLAWEGAALTTVLSASGATVGTAIAAGSTALTITLPTTGALLAADVIIIGAGVYQERIAIASITGTAVTLATAVNYAHAIGEPVFRPGTQTGAFGRPTDITARVLAVLAPLTITDPTVGNVRLLRTYAFRKAKLQDGAKQINHTQENDWTLAVGFNCYRDPAITDITTDTFTIFDETL